MTETQSDMKNCAMCAEAIRASAKKCVHCGSDQGWLGRLSPSITVLSLLTALVSVVALSAPVLKTVFTPIGARFTFSAPEFMIGSVSLEAKNIGGAPATLDSAVIFIPQKKGGQPYMFGLSAKGTDSEQRIQPGEIKRLTFEFDRKAYDTPPVAESDVGCSMELFDSTREVGCDEVRYLGGEPGISINRKGNLPEEGPATLAHKAKWRRYRD